MCRWLAYSGAPIHLDEVIVDAPHSLIDQSLHARQSATTTNGDGFGIGWYGTREFPGVVGWRQRCLGTPALCDCCTS